MPRGWRHIAVAMSLLGSLARATDRPLAGSKLLVQDPAGNALRRKIVVTATGPVGTTGLAGDPTADGAGLHIVTQGGTHPCPTPASTAAPDPRTRNGSARKPHSYRQVAVRSILGDEW